MRETTYGFESEWQTGAEAVIGRLADLGLAADGRLHGYHCSCESCEFFNGWPFRGQTDSSCSGEIITDVLGVADEGQADYDIETMTKALAKAAIEVDAEPGLNSAFHVHVSVDYLPTEQLRQQLWQFVLWEPVLSRIAGGRWSEQRTGMNTTMRRVLADDFYRYIGEERPSTSGLLRWQDDAVDEWDTFQERILYVAQVSDRHSNLNVGQHRAPTWEFRLWNSTRSAWRMQMFCDLSIALTDATVIEALSELKPPERLRRPSTGIDNVALAVSTGGYDNLAELLQRQAHYLDNRAGEAPSVLTSL